MCKPGELFSRKGILTGPFAYIRWLGDRYAIERITNSWGDTVLDRRPDLELWTPHLQRLIERGFPIYGYVNNHYAGYAPETVTLLRELLGRSE